MGARSHTGPLGEGDKPIGDERCPKGANKSGVYDFRGKEAYVTTQQWGDKTLLFMLPLDIAADTLQALEDFVPELMQCTGSTRAWLNPGMSRVGLVPDHVAWHRRPARIDLPPWRPFLGKRYAKRLTAKAKKAFASVEMEEFDPDLSPKTRKKYEAAQQALSPLAKSLENWGPYSPF